MHASSTESPATAQDSTAAELKKTALIARCRLKEAKQWFIRQGWEQLPKGERGRSILRWGADHAWMASPTNPKRSVRRWCRCWKRRISNTELDEIVAETETSNKRWSADQSAIVLGISVTDRIETGFRHLGADDDPNYEIRLGIERANSAKRSQRYRAKNRTGAKRGRPKSEVPAWQLAGFKSKRTYQRHKAAAKKAGVALGTGVNDGTKNASRHLSKSRRRDGISVPNAADVVGGPVDASASPLPVVVLKPVEERRKEPQATPRRAPDDVIEAEWVDNGVGFARATPPPHRDHAQRGIERALWRQQQAGLR